MFGILYTLFQGGIYLVGNARNAMINAENKKKYYRASSNSYIDYRGVWRNVSNNEALRVDTVNGDKCVIEERTKRVVRNVSEDNRIEAKAQAIKDGKTVYKYSDGIRPGVIDDGCVGTIYKDIETDRMYVIRRMPNHCDYYMDIETMKLVRITDESLKIYNPYPSKKSKMLSDIQFYNKDQDKHIKENASDDYKYLNMYC